ncbi:hypothetical protein RHMOL_Rhmol04G0218800 [Rhododendron molle]|uniref:Uncharacterized protein n=1 Tax=Rhododendron molle TaxID=49168 RepID=A0ACC0P348_RHOML|nr:hypothetical protein RHMOL_Rhmol04G0218800 [Rhododendron molle]
MHPETTTPPGAIVFPQETQEARNAFTVKPGALNNLPTFYGKECDDPYEHVRTFKGLVRNLASNTQYENVCLKLFEATLRDGALMWFRMQKSQSFTTWVQVRDAFYRKYFSEAKTKSFRRQIQRFRQEREESFLKAWERFKELLLRLPHHGFERIQLIGFFHLGFNAETVQHIEYSYKGDDFLSKTADQAWDFLDDLADRQRALEPSNFERSGPSGSNVVPITICDQRLQAQVEKMAQRLEELEVRQVRSVSEVSIEEVCLWFECKGHTATVCPGFITATGASQFNQEEVNAIRAWDPYSNTYNAGWKDHPNFGWSDSRPAGGGQAQPFALPPPQQFQQAQSSRPPQGQVIPFHFQPQPDRGAGPSTRGPPPGYSQMTARDHKLEDNVNFLMQSQMTFQTKIRQQIGALTTQMSQLTTVVGQLQQEKGRFLAQGSTAGAHYLGNSLGSRQEKAKLVTILRSGKEIDKSIPPNQKPAPPPEPDLGKAMVTLFRFDLGKRPGESRGDSRGDVGCIELGIWDIIVVYGDLW